MSRLALMAPPADDEPENALPTYERLAVSQAHAAIKRLHEDRSSYPRFARWPSLAKITGALAPDELWLVGGRQGNGKSLLCQNVLDQMVEQEIPTLYIGTEQSHEVLKIKQACLKLGLSPRWILKPEREDAESQAYADAMEAVEDQLKTFASGPYSSLMFFANTSYITREELTKWITGGVRKYGIKFVIIDHIDHMEHGDGTNQRAEIDRTIAHVDVLLKTHHIPGLVASQIKRTHGDAFQRYSPPAAEDFAESSKKERVASGMLSLWRPLRTDLDPKELRALQDKAKQGEAAEGKIYQPNTMGVRCVKDRLGEVPGLQTFLTVGKGNLLTEDEATAHGISTTQRSFV